MRRVQQVAVVLKKELASLIEKLLDQKYGLVTLIDVDIRSDLKEATAYVSCLDETYQKEVLKILNINTKEFQHILGRRLRWKFTPKINFTPYHGLKNVAKVEELLEKIKN